MESGRPKKPRIGWGQDPPKEWEIFGGGTSPGLRQLLVALAVLVSIPSPESGSCHQASHPRPVTVSREFDSSIYFFFNSQLHKIHRVPDK